MPSKGQIKLRRFAPAAYILVLIAALFVAALPPTASAEEADATAARFSFTEMPIALPPGLPERTIRQVNPAYDGIQAWISSVGAGIAINDLAGTGVAADICLVDTRSDSAIVTPAPGTGNRYAPFVLDPGAGLPVDNTMAPMGCTPADVNGDGRMDLIVYYWGRTPIVFLHKDTTSTVLGNGVYTPTEMVPEMPSGGHYNGKIWNTNAVAVADFDGDGHPDVGVFNYFPDSQVLAPTGQPDVHMNHSLSRAANAGGAHIMRFVTGTGGARPSVSYEEQVNAVPYAYATGWTLGAASADLDGDMLPELYLANDFGPDWLFHNVSTRGHIKFAITNGRRGALTPKSMVLGNDSFKGMGVDFGDLTNAGKFDMFVSNITVTHGLEESNFLWMNNTDSAAAAKAKLDRGTAPFDQKASDYGMAWTGWGWDAKMADFDNSGNLSIVQADGFVKGTINRWSWLQELAMTNDTLLENPLMWPKEKAGDDIAGRESIAFWAKGPDGRYINVSSRLGLTYPTPTRGIAVADTDGDGAQDFAVARQWGPPAFYHNNHPGTGQYLGLRLYRPAGGIGVVGTPAYGAQVRLVAADGHTQLAQLDGGGGHSGKRSFDVFFGLGANGDAPASAELRWRDVNGAIHRQTLSLTPGWHDLMLTDHAQEVPQS